MMVNINLKVSHFGQVIFEIGKPIPPIEVKPVNPTRGEISYLEPLETASRIYEVQYQEELMNYIVPLFTA